MLLPIRWTEIGKLCKALIGKDLSSYWCQEKGHLQSCPKLPTPSILPIFGHKGSQTSKCDYSQTVRATALKFRLWTFRDEDFLTDKSTCPPDICTIRDVNTECSGNIFLVLLGTLGTKFLVHATGEWINPAFLLVLHNGLTLRDNKGNEKDIASSDWDD